MNVWFALLLASVCFAKFGPPTQTSVPQAYDLQPLDTPNGLLLVVSQIPQNSNLNAALLLLDAETFQQLDNFNLPSCIPELTQISPSQILLTCPAYTSGCAPTLLAIIQLTPTNKLYLSQQLTPNHCSHLLLPSVSLSPPEIFYLSSDSSTNVFLDKLDLKTFKMSTLIPNASIVNNSWLTATVAFDENSNAPLLISSFYSTNSPVVSTWTLAAGPTTPSPTGRIFFTHRQETTQSALVPVVFPSTKSNGITIADVGSSFLQILNWDFANWDSTLGSLDLPGTNFYSGGVIVNANLNNLFIAGYGTAGKYTTLSQISIQNGIATKVLDQVYLNEQVNTLKFDADNNNLFLISNDQIFKYPIM